MNARDSILARLRAAPSGADAPLPDVAGWFACVMQDVPATRLARFKVNIEAAHAEIHETDAANWPALLIEIAARKQLRNLLVGNGSPLASRLLSQPHDALDIMSYANQGSAWRIELFESINASLTTARSAIANTGSLILWPDASEPRLMSLVPAVHFVLLDPTKIHANLHAAMLAEHWAAGMPTNALVISGPSKTADIQQTLAYGAHGPRELVVLLCHGLDTKGAV